MSMLNDHVEAQEQGLSLKHKALSHFMTCSTTSIPNVSSYDTSQCNSTQSALKQFSSHLAMAEPVPASSVDEDSTITSLLLSTLRMMAESPLPSVSTVEPDVGFSSTTTSTNSFELDPLGYLRPTNMNSTVSSTVVKQDYTRTNISPYAKTAVESSQLLDHWNNYRKNRNVLLKASYMPLTYTEESSFYHTSLVNDLLSHKGKADLNLLDANDSTLYSLEPPVLDLNSKYFPKSTLFMATSDVESFFLDGNENKEFKKRTESFAQAMLDYNTYSGSTLRGNTKEQQVEEEEKSSCVSPLTLNKSGVPLSSRVNTPTSQHLQKQFQNKKQLKNVNRPEYHSLHLSFNRAGNGPTYWGMWEDERSRMVYVSWLPRAARANDRAEKKQCEVHLKHFISDVLGFSGLLKVLLFPPASAHCKLLFASEDSARCFLETFGTIKGTDGAALWKSLVCQHFRVNMQYGISATHVRIIWADQTKTDSELLTHSMISRVSQTLGFLSPPLLPSSSPSLLDHSEKKYYHA